MVIHCACCVERGLCVDGKEQLDDMWGSGGFGVLRGPNEFMVAG